MDAESLKDPRTERWFQGGKTKFMVEKSGYVMVRKDYEMPFVMSLKEWLDLPDADTGRIYANEFKKAVFR